MNDTYELLSKRYDSHIASGYYNYLIKKFNLITSKHKKGSTHLDIGCGTGDLLKYSYETGFRCEGIDTSKGMIDVAALKLDNNIKLRCVDFMKLNNESWDIITANNDVFNYVGLAYEIDEILLKLINLLSPNGVLLFDIVTDKDMKNGWNNESNWSISDKKTFICNISYDINNQIDMIGKVTRKWYSLHKNKKNLFKIDRELLKGINKNKIIDFCKNKETSFKEFLWFNGNSAFIINKTISS